MMLDIQYASAVSPLPAREDIQIWIDATLAVLAEMADEPVPEEESPRIPVRPPVHSLSGDFDLTVRIVDEQEILQLNQTYRGQEKTTNVLSFPCELPGSLALNLLGDIIICAGVVAREAGEQQKEPSAHWAHMVIHGTLHLLGFDHISEGPAVQMESIEARVLAHLGFPDPYGEMAGIR